MTPATLNLEIKTGTTFGPIVITCKNTAGDPIDLTGWTVWAHVRKSPVGAIVHDLTPEITNPTGGQITISQTDEQTASAESGTFQWDLLLENSEGERLPPYLKGSCIITRAISQPEKA